MNQRVDLDDLSEVFADDPRTQESIARFRREVPMLARPFDEEADPRHVTGSAIVVGGRGVVLHRHKRLGIWLQPGGHIETGETPSEGAFREALEETGLPVRHPGSGRRLVHVDVHPGPRGHTHYDLRYLLVAPPVEPEPHEGESPDVAWFEWDEAIRIADEGLRYALLALRPLCVFSFGEATPSAGAEVGDVWLRSRSWALPTVRNAHPDDEVREWVGDTLIPAGGTWVARNGHGVVVAMMSMEPGWIDQLYVDPSVVGFGIGERFVDLAKSRSPEGLELWTFQCNSAAVRFYGRQGFVEAERTDGSANEEGEPDIRMVWRP